MVQATCAGEAEKTVWKVGWATLTTVMSRIDMIAPSTTTPATRRTSLSSLPDAESGGTDEGWGGVCVVTGKGYGNAELRRTSIPPAATFAGSHCGTAQPSTD